MKKRMLSFLLVLTLMLSILPAMAPAVSAASNMVAKVEAVGTGYAYDSEEGAFAPTFSSMTAYDPGGNAIDIEGFVWSTPFYTKESFGSANRLFNEPEGGETYYFGIYVDQYVNKDLSYGYTDSKDLMEKSVVTLPGFYVECISFMEREMGSYLELTYAATRKYPVVEVGGTKLYDGDTYQGSEGGTLTVDGYNVTMNNFKDPSSVAIQNYYCRDYFEENRPVYSDMDATLKLTIIGENSVGSIGAMRDLEIYGTIPYRHLLPRRRTLRGDGSQPRRLRRGSAGAGGGGHVLQGLAHRGRGILRFLRTCHRRSGTLWRLWLCGGLLLRH